MKTKEIKIDVPVGYAIDKVNSTFEHIIFTPIESKFSDYGGNFTINGFYISNDSRIIDGEFHNYKTTRNMFTTEKQAKSALAMAQISQIMANDERFGKVVTDEEWNNVSLPKYCFFRYDNKLQKDVIYHTYTFLAFHTEEQRDLFLQENEQLIKDYLMLD